MLPVLLNTLPMPALSSLPQAVSALAGRWKLVYTSNTATLLLLGALDRLPLVEVGDVCQEVDPHGLTATNKVCKRWPSVQEDPGTRPGVAMVLGCLEVAAAEAA